MEKNANVPSYKLYGEHEAWPTPDMMHCELIAERSHLHDWHIKPHQHNGLFQILYLQRGTARVQLDGQESGMHGGEVLLVPQNCVHGFEFSCDALGYVLTVAYPLMIKLTRAMEGGMAGLSQPCRHFLGEDEGSHYLCATFEAFIREYRSTARHRNVIVETLLTAIVVFLSRNLKQTRVQGPLDTRGNSHFARFCELIEKHYEKHYSLEFYAKEVGVTTANLNLLSRRIAQKSALELIHERILLEAKRNLIYTSMSISELSYAIGFSDPAYFTRFFKKATGEAPKAFRQRVDELGVKP